jgi:hypothetical protein
MGTHHGYRRNLAGLLFLVALVALCCGGCGKTASKGGPAFEPARSEPWIVNSGAVAEEPDDGTVTICDEPSADMAEAGVLGYSDPTASEPMSTPSLTDNGCMFEQMGDTDDGCSEPVTPSMANWGEDRVEMMGEESNGEANEGLESGGYPEGMYDETPWTPEVTEQEYTPEPTGDMDDRGSDTVVPYIEGENQTTPDGNCVDVTSDGLGTTTMNGMSWIWANDFRLILNSWWQATITGADDSDTRPYEAYIPGMPPEGDTVASGDDAALGPPP